MDDQPLLPGMPPPSPPTTKPYRPSNGTEGEWFIGWQCEHCVRVGRDCDIITFTMAYGVDDLEYPTEWVSDLDGNNPRCTAFQFEGLLA